MGSNDARCQGASEPPHDAQDKGTSWPAHDAHEGTYGHTHDARNEKIAHDGKTQVSSQMCLVQLPEQHHSTSHTLHVDVMSHTLQSLDQPLHPSLMKRVDVRMKLTCAESCTKVRGQSTLQNGS